jgi:hypothetical protein
MEHEFKNRIAAQRAILAVINSRTWPSEELCGLSNKAIDRWVSINRLEPRSHLVELVKDASDKLFFLANKSQETVSEAYKAVRAEISGICQAIRAEIDLGRQLYVPPP